MPATAVPILHISVSGIPEFKQGLQKAVQPEMMMDAAGRGVSNLIIKHLRKRNARPGRPGWPKSNYWEDAASSTQTKIGSTAAVITIHAPGLRLHLEGGTVNAKPGKAFAIPARPEVANIWPSEYDPNRIFMLVRKALGKAYLAERDGSGHLRILWRLVKKTTHHKDSTVLPTSSSLTLAATNAIKSILPQKP